MFMVQKGDVLKVHTARTGNKSTTGAPYGLLKFMESENQRAGIERPSLSSSTINVWFDSKEAVEGINDGDNVRIVDFAGLKWLHEQYYDQQTGKPRYRDVIELIGVTVEKA